MKKITYSVLLAAGILFFSSCRKDDGVTITKVINVELNVNQSYRFEVPHAGDADDIMQITRQASEFQVSQVTATSSGSALFDYTPALNYTGTDEVQISNQEGDHHNSGGNHGNCSGNGMKHHHDDTTIYIFRITIRNAATRTAHTPKISSTRVF